MNTLKSTKNHTSTRSTSALWRMLFFTFAFAYLEFLFHLSVYGGIDSGIIHPLFFAAACGLTLSLLCSFWNRVANAVTAYLLWSVFTVYYITQFVYYKIFRTFLSLVSIGGAQDAMNFKSVLLAALKNNWYFIVLFLLPLICLIVLNRLFFSFGRCSLGKTGHKVIRALSTNVIAATVMWITAIGLLGISGKEAYSPYALFHGRYVLELSMNKLGVMVTTARDSITMLTKSNSSRTFELANGADISLKTAYAGSDTSDNVQKPDTAETSGTEAATEEPEDIPVPQIDPEIDFGKLYSSTDDEELKSLSAYFSGVEPTYQDEYTGMFKGYNVVFVTAESLSTYGISEEATPTLYKIYHDGFEFTNFYNPLWYHSTIDGEYTNCLSQYPASSKWSFEASADTYQPYALGNILNAEGYKSYGYHDFDAT